MKQKELNRILNLHKKWLNSEEGGERADLRGADFQYVTLSGVNLEGADLQGADL